MVTPCKWRGQWMYGDLPDIARLNKLRWSWPAPIGNIEAHFDKMTPASKARPVILQITDKTNWEAKLFENPNLAVEYLKEVSIASQGKESDQPPGGTSLGRVPETSDDDLPPVTLVDVRNTTSSPCISTVDARANPAGSERVLNIPMFTEPSSGLETVCSHSSEQQAVANARVMSSIYDDGYAFPSWSVDMLEDGELDDFMEHTTVYHNSIQQEVENIVRMREPVSIATHRLYDKGKLQKEFNYSIGAYAAAPMDRLPPNVAIYCKTPIYHKGEVAAVHVINLIPFTFDSVDQRDYKYFFGQNGVITPDKWCELVEAMSQMWRYAFQCAVHKGLEYLFLTDVGGGVFASLLSGRYGYDELKKQSLDPVKAEFEGRVEVRQLQRIPDMVFAEDFVLLRETSLLVNAWDPFSMIGNGNEQDCSLNGFWGRCTAMAVLCWPLTNRKMQYQNVNPPLVGGGLLRKK